VRVHHDTRRPASQPEREQNEDFRRASLGVAEGRSDLIDTNGVLRLQRLAGNHAVTTFLQRCGAVPADRCGCHDDERLVQRTLSADSPGERLPLQRSGPEPESDSPRPDAVYRIRKGDTLFGITSAAFGVSAGKERLRLARVINEDPANRPLWTDDISDNERSLFGGARISFRPRFTCEPEGPGGPCAPGNCFATIRIPSDPKTTPDPAPAQDEKLNIQVTFTHPPIPEDPDHSQENPGPPVPGRERAGYTSADVKARFEIAWEEKAQDQGQKLVWPKTASATIFLDHLQVAVSALYSVESCPYHVTLDHELSHAEAFVSILVAGEAPLWAGLETTPMPSAMTPELVPEASLKEEKARIGLPLYKVVKAHKARITAQMRKDREAKDSPAEYAKVYGRCSPADWGGGTPKGDKPKDPKELVCSAKPPGSSLTKREIAEQAHQEAWGWLRAAASAMTMRDAANPDEEATQPVRQATQRRFRLASVKSLKGHGDTAGIALWHDVYGVVTRMLDAADTKYRCDCRGPYAITWPGLRHISLCRDFFSLSQPKQAGVLVHEWAHRYGPPVARKVKETYCPEADFGALSREQLVQMPDAYMLLVWDLAGPAPTPCF